MAGGEAAESGRKRGRTQCATRYEMASVWIFGNLALNWEKTSYAICEPGKCQVSASSRKPCSSPSHFQPCSRRRCGRGCAL